MASPTAIITGVLDVQPDPGNPAQVIVSTEYRMLFVPDGSSPPLLEQADLVLPDGFTKNDLKAASQNWIIASAAAKGAVLVSTRIFTIADLA